MVLHEKQEVTERTNPEGNEVQLELGAEGNEVQLELGAEGLTSEGEDTAKGDGALGESSMGLLWGPLMVSRETDQDEAAAVLPEDCNGHKVCIAHTHLYALLCLHSMCDFPA